MNVIPIILSADDYYAPQMSVAMLSVLKNKHKNTKYDFYLMVSKNFSERHKSKITRLAHRYKCDVSFIVMENVFDDRTIFSPHITTPTYYRLLAADLLPQKYVKCIYLDVDTCVLQDLSDLYNIDMADNYIAGVPALNYYLDNARHTARLKIPTTKHYINVGILIMNLTLIRANNLTSKFVELSKQDYESQDQDVLNVACFGRIKMLPLKYNVMTKYNFTDIQNPAFYDVYGHENIADALSAPAIIHYADQIKPWTDKNSKYAKLWWKYARQSPFALTFFIRCCLKRLFNK